MQGFRVSDDLDLVERLGRALGRPLEASEAAALGAYVEQVATWNRKLDLTGATTPAAQVEVMLGDALVLSDAELVVGSGRLLDVGSGAGAPVLPLLLLRPDLEAVLVEPLHKRVAFLRSAIGRLGLARRARVLERRLEERSDPAELGGPFDLALSRATFAPERWLELGLALAPRVLLLLAAAEPPSASDGAELARTRDYSLPESGAPRRVALYARLGAR